MDWTHEMDRMLSVFERQAMQSLGVIKLAFRNNGLPFESTFKGYFLRASTNRLSETFDRFEFKSQLEDEVLGHAGKLESLSEYVASEVELTYGSAGASQIDDPNEEDVAVETPEIEPIEDLSAAESDAPSNSITIEAEMGTIDTSNTTDTYNSNEESMTTDDSHETNAKTIAYQSIHNESYIFDPEVRSDSSFDVEMDESADAIEMVEHENGSTDTEDNELIPMNDVFRRLDKTTIAGSGEDRIKTTRLNRIKSIKKRLTTTTGTHIYRIGSAAKGGKSPPKQLAPRNVMRCTVCGYVTIHKRHFNKHMQIHTGEKPFGCDRCGKRFTSAQTLLKHATTHIAEFKFHCRACFRGFLSKVEAVTHEKQCQQRHYECHLCKKFVTFAKHELIRHMRKHTGDKPFRCEICMKNFGWKRGLKLHLNNVHVKMSK